MYKGGYDKNRIYIYYNGYACPYDTFPCSKCSFRYAFVCPQCKWGINHPDVNTYHHLNMAQVFMSKGIKDWKDIWAEERARKGKTDGK